jgi:GxxExxY protein
MQYRAREDIKNDSVTEKIIAACFNVHKALGPGFNEKIYRNALKLAIENIPFKCSVEKRYNVEYENKVVGNLIVDFIVEDKIIVEIKAITGIMPKVFEQQILSYLKVTDLKIGLLVNFGEKSCQVKRYIN